MSTTIHSGLISQPAGIAGAVLGHDLPVRLRMSRRDGRPAGGDFIEAYLAPDTHMRPVGETVALLGSPAARRTAGPVRWGPNGKNLVDTHTALFEGQCAANHVEPPDPRRRFTDEIDDLRPLPLKRVQPGQGRTDGVLTHRVNITDLKPGGLKESASA